MLKFSFKALCELEKLSGKPIDKFFNGLKDNQSLTDIAIAWQAGRYGASNSAISFDEACDEIDELGLNEAMRQLEGAASEVFKANDEESDEEEKPQNP